MYSGMAIIALLVNLVIIACVVTFAIKLLNRLTDIADAQKSVAASQEKLVQILVSQAKSAPSDNM
jgi:large-conductance mechanosensitive channel